MVSGTVPGTACGPSYAGSQVPLQAEPASMGQDWQLSQVIPSTVQGTVSFRNMPLLNQNMLVTAFLVGKVFCKRKMYIRLIKCFCLLLAHPPCANGFFLPQIFLFPEVNVFFLWEKKKKKSGKNLRLNSHQMGKKASLWGQSGVLRLLWVPNLDLNTVSAEWKEARWDLDLETHTSYSGSRTCLHGRMVSQN